MAVFCQQNSNNPRLTDWERGFVSGDLPSNMIKFGKPTPKQAKQLLGIFVKLGGYYDPKTAHVYS
jgi:hypothetical protein